MKKFKGNNKRLIASGTLLIIALVASSFAFFKKGYHAHLRKVLIAQPDNRPNILLIVSEDNNKDLGCYGNPYVKTPVLDSLSRKGVRLNNACVTYSVCSPSRGTILTGLYPHQNGQMGLATHKYHIYKDITTLPTYLHNAGYRTGCVGKIHVAPESQIPFDFRPQKGSPLNGENFARKDFLQYTSVADSFIRMSDQPFFLMVNYPDAHAPWLHQIEGMPKNPIDGKDIKAPLPYIGANSEHLRHYVAEYYNCISRMDEMVGKLLEKLRQSGKDKNTIIIYMADHGAEFSRGKFSNYESGLNVPMIVYWPGLTKAGWVSNELVSTIDLLPTFLAAAKADIPKTLPGLPIMPLLNGKPISNWRRYIFAETEGSFPHAYYPRSSVRDSRYKLIHNLLISRENPEFKLYNDHDIAGFEGGTEEKEIAASSKMIQQAYAVWRNPPEYELYDLKTDPNEFVNLSADTRYSKQLSRLREVLANWQKETNDPLANKKMLERYTAEVDSIIRTHPKMDDAKDKSYILHYPEYFLREKGKVNQ